MTGIDVPQRLEDFLASLYQPRFSSNISQTLSRFLGGAVVHPTMLVTARSIAISLINFALHAQQKEPSSHLHS